MDLQIGDIVLIQDKNPSPTHSLIGRVVQTYPGSDSLVRKSTLRARNGFIIRVVQTLSPFLDVDNFEGFSSARLVSGW